MKKILLSIAILMTILIVSVGCSDQDVFKINLTQEDKAEKLSRADYMLRMREVGDNMVDKIGYDDERDKNEIYKKAVEMLPKEYKDLTDDELSDLKRVAGIYIEDKYYAEEYSKITCEDEEVAKVHKKLVDLSISDAENYYEIVKIHIENPIYENITDKEVIRELDVRTSESGMGSLHKQADYFEELDSLLDGELLEEDISVIH